MGMFDTIRWYCPHCGEQHSEQTKCGPCELIDYEIANGLPAELVHVVTGDHICDYCGLSYRISVPDPDMMHVYIRKLIPAPSALDATTVGRR